MSAFSFKDWVEGTIIGVAIKMCHLWVAHCQDVSSFGRLNLRGGWRKHVSAKLLGLIL